MKKIIICLAIPLIALGLFVSYNYAVSKTKIAEAIFDVEGYDSDDLLSESYIRFRIKYKSKYLNQYDRRCKEKPFVCLETDENGFVVNDYAVSNKKECKILMKRPCSERTKKLSRFYVPKNYASFLDKGLSSSNNRKVKASISKTGMLYVTDFYIDGINWEKYVWKVKEEFIHKNNKKRRGSR